MLSNEMLALIHALERIMQRRTVYRRTVAAATGIPPYRVREILDAKMEMSLQEYLLICRACRVDPTVPLAMASAGIRKGAMDHA